MGRSDIDTMADPKEIKREKNAEIKLNDQALKEELTEKKIPSPDPVQKSGKTDRAGREEVKGGTKEKLDALKESAGTMPHHIPSKKAEKERPAKPLTKQQKKDQEAAVRQEAAGELEDVHRTLENEENRAFGKKGVEEVRRTRYESLSERDKKKRVDAAIKRKANAAKLTEVEGGLQGLFKTCEKLDKSTFEKALRGFMMLTERPFIMDKDDAFVRNLKRNYELCETAWRMKQWVSDAVEGGYFPKNYDLAAVEAKIARYFDLKEYLDTQKELMKNPYYQYMAKQDISYSDAQLERLKKNTGNEKLREYLTTVKKLRGLSFVRKKDMDSVMDRSVKEGKRQAEILRTRAEKRQLMHIFSAEALNINEDRRVRDKDYDARFTPEGFEKALRNFRKLNVKDLHFRNIRDIAEHFKDNARMFDENREFERMLFIAIQRDLTPADDVMVELRSKIKAFKNAEYMMNNIQQKIIREPDSFLKEKTYAEFLEKCRSDVKTSVAPSEAYDMPVPGQNMDSYYKSVLKAVKREHKGRKEEIRKTYGFTHPVKHEDEGTGDVSWSLGAISREELERRSAEYEKNVFINEYIVDLETYTASGYGSRVESFAAAYGKIKGKDLSSVLERVATRYVQGMSDKELKAFVDIEGFGTPEEREKLWAKVLREGASLNYSELDSNDPKVIMHNMAYKTRVAGMQGNFAGSLSPFPKRITDKDMLDQAQLIYDVGCGHCQNNAALAQLMAFKLLRSLSIKDINSLDDELLYDLHLTIESVKNKDGDSQIIMDGKVIAGNNMEISNFLSALGRPKDLKSFKKSQYNDRRIDGGYINTAPISMYESRKHHGMITDTTGEDLRKIREFYEANIGRGEKKKGILFGKTDPQEMVTILEDAFKKIMSFDLSLFNFKSYKDIVDSAGKDQERFKACRDIVRLGRDAMNCLAEYDQCRRLGAVCLLNEDHINELKARYMVINHAGTFFDERFLEVLGSPALEKTGMSLDEIMHLSEQEINEKRDAARAAKDDEAATLWANIWNINSLLDGFDLGMDLNTFIPAMRLKYKCYGEPLDKEILNILNRKAGVTEGTDIGEIKVKNESETEFLGRFSEAFSEKDLTVTERESKLVHPDSRLRTKRVNAETLMSGREEAVNARIAARRKISVETRMAVGEEDLVHLSAFMSGDQKADEDMLREYADKDTRSGLLDKLTQRILGISLDLNIADDTQFASNARILEEISSVARAYDALLKENPDYIDRLRVRRQGSDSSDHDIVKKKLDRLLSLSDLYRARAVLITDPYYITHYDDELSADRGGKTSYEEGQVADMIRLTAECLRRIDGESLISGSGSDMDAILTSMEKRSLRKGYLTGRPDLKKADISYTAKADREIATYFGKILETNKDLMIYDIKNMIGSSTEEHPFPQLVRYETEAVKNHIAMIKVHHRFFDKDLKSSLMDDKQKKLWDRLLPMLNSIRKFELIDPATKETLSFRTNPQRIINSLVFAYRNNLPEEEILEIVDGLNVIAVNKLDVNDPKIFAYAKQRWLDSVKKLFYLEYNSMKRYENTYGTLPDQLPPGSFMHSLGRSKGELYKRTLFGTDLSEISDEKKCMVGGKSLSMGEYLVREGLINEDELEEVKHLNGAFYMQANSLYQQVYSQAVAVFGEGDDISDGYEHRTMSMLSQLYVRRHYDIKGPKISQDKERKYWKDAFEKGERSLYGNDEIMFFRQDHLNTYSASELQEMRERRKNEAGLIKSYEETVSERAKVLSTRIKELAGDGVSADLIDRMIFFHPDMMTETEPGKISDRTNDDFIALVKSYAGIGVPDGEKSKERSGAYRKMTELMNGVIGKGYTARRADELIEEQTYIDRNSKVYYRSRLMRTTLLEHISDTVQSLMKEETDKSLIDEDTYRRFRLNQTEALSNIIMRNMKTKKRYLELKDLGNREITVPDIELGELERLLNDLTEKGRHVDEVLNDDRRELIKRLYGIDIASTAEIMGLEEKKPAEEKIKEQPVSKSIEENRVEESHSEIKKEAAVPKVKLPALPKYKQDINMTTGEYENQGYHNCWCVAGAALFNRFMGKKLVDQYDMRAFSPSDKEIKTFAEIDSMGQNISEKEYKEIVEDYRKYMGKDCTDFGSIYQAADFFLKQNPDMAVRRMFISLPSLMKKEKKKFVPKTEEEKQEDLLRYHKQKAVFLDQINEVLATGNPVAILDTGKRHYKTVTGVDGEWITLLDSSGNVEERKRLDDVLRRADDSNMIELTWLSHIKDPKDEMKDQPNLTYSDVGGFGLMNPTLENARNPMWVEGVSASKDDDELHIVRSSYLPVKKIKSEEKMKQRTGK